jgi:8-amino-7-oxononanoate synthase
MPLEFSTIYIESALIFNSGYDANLGLYSTIAQKGDCIIFDELAHNSIREGIKGSKCSYRASFKHNNVDDLRQKIESVRMDGCKGNIIVGVEGVYSMDGDIAPLNMLQNLCETLGAVLIVDEAHSTGVKGRHGEGLVNEVLAAFFSFNQFFFPYC